MLRRRKYTKGQSFLEMAIITPAILTLLIAVGDYARVFYAAQEVSNAARAGAQYGAQNLTTSVDTTGIASAATSDASNVSGLTASSSVYCTCSGSVVACNPPGCSAPKAFVRVTTTATFRTAFNWYLLPSSTPLTSTTVLQIQE